MALGWLQWRAWAAAFCVAGVALGDIDLHFAWQSLCVAGVAGVALMALGWLRWRAWAGVDGVDAAAFCVAGVALLRHPPYFHVAGVALGDMDRHFAWQAWHLWRWAGSGGALGPEWTGWTPRLFAWQAWHDMDRHFAWQAWHLRRCAGSGGALGPKWAR